jgi:hypothetical protein
VTVRKGAAYVREHHIQIPSPAAWMTDIERGGNGTRKTSRIDIAQEIEQVLVRHALSLSCTHQATSNCSM